jgi:general secretion pathway protein K
VLWLSAALSAVAFSLANTVRGETERSATGVDGLRSQCLADAALRRAILYMDWARKHPEEPRLKPPGPAYRFTFPEGETLVEVIPETSKLNINQASAEDLFSLLTALGLDQGRAQGIAAAIIDWRSQSPEGPSQFDEFYMTLRPPFHAPHAMFQEVEELLSVRGVTPDLYYGTWVRTPEGSPRRLAPRNGLGDCVSVFGTTGQFDVNTAPPAVLAAAGVPPDAVAAIVEHRRTTPFLTPGDLAAFAQSAGAGFGRLRLGGNSIFTLRATARVRLANGQLSDLRRTVAAQVKLMPPGYDSSYHILRWYDNATPAF